MHPRPEIELVEDHKRLLQALRADVPRSRIELSRLLDINNGVVTRLSRELIALGLIAEADAQAGARGRPSLPLRLRADGAYAIGAATHPGWVDLCVVDFSGRPLAQKSVPWDEGEPGDFAAMLTDAAAELTAGLALRRARFLGFGVSVPGFAVGAHAQRHTVQRLRSWRDQDLSARLGAALGGPVWIENDANAAAVAEYYDAEAPAGSSMLVLFLGYGVGGGCISAGRLFEGEYGNAGEIGTLYPLDRPRPSAVDFVQALERAEGAAIDPLALSDHLDRHGDAIAAWIDRAVGQLDLALLSGIAWFDPASVVLSGTLPSSVLDALAARLRDLPWEARLGARRVPPIRASRLKGAAAAIGAAFLPIHHMIAPRN